MEDSYIIELLIEGDLPPGLAEMIPPENPDDDWNDPEFLLDMLNTTDSERMMFRDRLKAKEEELEATKDSLNTVTRSIEIVRERRGSTREEKSCIDDQQAQEGPVTVDPKVIASRLGKSLRWIYDHAGELGAVKIGRLWVFTEEGLKDALQRRETGSMERSGQTTRAKVLPRLSDKARGRSLGSRETERAGGGGEADRHGLRDILRRVS